MSKSAIASVLATAMLLAGARAAFAQAEAEAAVEVEAEAQTQPPDAPPEPYAPPPEYQAQAAPVPPHVETAPAPAAGGGGYCFGGPHPVDTRVEAGPAWDETQGTHLHRHPPFDLRLFVLRNGCYYFIGDPTDFGYRGNTYRYYGAHPVLDLYGGGWCFLIGGHAHWWRPWSPYFTVAGPWYYWYGPYDPYFWSYWPYYAHYHRAYYPRYYRGGRFYRGSPRDRLVAPPVGRVAAAPARAMPVGSGGMSTGRSPAPANRGSWNRTPGWSSPAAPSRVGGDVPSVGWSQRPESNRGNRSGIPAAPSTTFTTPVPRSGFQGDASGWTGTHRAPATVAPSSGFRAPAPSAAPSTTYRAPAPSAAPAQGWSPSFRSAPSAPAGGWGGGSFRSAPAQSAPSFRSAPSSSPSPSFRGGGGSSGGGWRSGGGSGGGGVRWR
jgi:hypothetical protein